MTERALSARISNNPEVQKALPLSPADTWVLISLAFGPKPASVIADEVKDLSEGTFEIETERVSSVLRNCNQVGLVTRVSLEEARKRRTAAYHITEFGVEVLEAECKRIDFELKFKEKLKSK